MFVTCFSGLLIQPPSHSAAIFFFFEKHIHMYFLQLAFWTTQNILIKCRLTKLWSNTLSEHPACRGPAWAPVAGCFSALELG